MNENPEAEKGFCRRENERLGAGKARAYYQSAGGIDRGKKTEGSSQ
jgi:hypothetical protein